MKVLHISTGLGLGGAEILLYRLLAAQEQPGLTNEVISLGSPGPIGDRISALGVPLSCLNLKANFPNPLKLFTLRKWIKQAEADIVHCWMYHANLVGGLLAKLSVDAPIIWAIHQEIRDRSWIKPGTRAVIRAGALVSNFVPERIVSVSERALVSHVNLGFAEQKFSVIHNGFDSRQFFPVSGARKSVRAELGLDANAKLIGFFARFHPMKDHATFIQAAKRAHRQFPDLHFLLCGKGISAENNELMEWIKGAGLASSMHLLGIRNDLARLYSSLDIYSISSRSEGFPLAVGEAMACGVPCVVSDVGDAAKLVGQSGMVVPTRDPDALAEAWLEILHLTEGERKRRGRSARKRVVEEFGFAEMVENYYTLYRQVLGPDPKRAEENGE